MTEDELVAAYRRAEGSSPMSFLVECFDVRPAPFGGPVGDPYVEHSLAEAVERAAELANMYARLLEHDAKRYFRVYVIESDGSTRRMVKVLELP